MIKLKQMKKGTYIGRTDINGQKIYLGKTKVSVEIIHESKLFNKKEVIIKKNYKDLRKLAETSPFAKTKLKEAIQNKETITDKDFVIVKGVFIYDYSEMCFKLELDEETQIYGFKQGFKHGYVNFHQCEYQNLKVINKK